VFYFFHGSHKLLASACLASAQASGPHIFKLR